MLQKIFGFNARTHHLRTEVIAGITSFLMMAYILAVNPAIFSALPDMPTGAVFTATALASVIGTLCMALIAKRPFGLAPGMGLNAFFVYTVCIGMGYSWQFALTAVFLEGLVFIFITLTGLRSAIVNAIPKTLRHAISAGIGLFIAFIGMKNAGLIVDNEATFVALGRISDPQCLLTLFALFVTGALIVRKVPGGLIIGVVIATLAGIPMGVTHYQGIASMPHSIAPIFCQFEWEHVFTLDMAVVLFTFMFIDLFDTLGTVIGVCTKAGMTDENGRIPKLKQVFLADAIATTAGAMLGTSTTTTYVESASGVQQGGRTGLTAFVIALCFAISLFFSPLFLSVPAAATGAVLIIVGSFMLEPLVHIKLNDYRETIPAFVCVISMPLTYSISDGIMLGVITYTFINLLSSGMRHIHPGTVILTLLFLGKLLFF